MTMRGALAAVRGDANNVDKLDDLARAALAEGEEEQALEYLLTAADRTGEPLLWQWAGLLQRSIDEYEAAISSFAAAARRSPNDAGIAHGQARVALEAGLNAVDLFLRARALAPNDGEVALGLAAARNAIGDGELGASELAALVARAPEWLVGHQQLAQLRSIIGQRDRITESIEQAISRFPREAGLWSALFSIDLKQENYESLRRNIERAAEAGVAAQSLTLYRGIAASQLDDELFPDALFNAAPELSDQLALWRIRHLLRMSAVEEALPFIDRELGSARAWSTWPYASLAWRLADDDRSAWLEGDPRLVTIADLKTDLPPLDDLAASLRALHIASGEYVDQSVRGGTQTDGPLLSRVDPLIGSMRKAILGAVRAYVAQLPPNDPSHPTLSQRRDRRIRFSGSWSVRLRGGGRHSNHVHPQGWISSALYISLPRKQQSDAQDAGWFTIGEPQDELGIPLEPWRKIEPIPGRLVLFPSWMWHGTIPFSQGERLTIAFDVRPPI